MAIPNVITAQTGGRQFHAPTLTNYAGFVSGANATHHSLKNWSPLLNGYGRLFMVRTPYAISKMFAGSDANLYSKDSLFVQVKHIMEYMNRSVQGFGDKTLDVAGTAIQGGYAGRQFKTPTVTRETTESFSIGLYEFVGSPIFTVIDGWMNAIGDENSGLATYGWISGGTDENGQHRRLYAKPGEEDFGIEFNEANHTCEFIYVITDRSGSQVERAVMLADCFPTGITQTNVLNMPEGGTHDNVAYDITFNCVLHKSPIITAIANDLLKQYRIVSNHLNFNPELGDAVYAPGDTTQFQRSLGGVPVDSATGTNIGNVPVFKFNNSPKTVQTDFKDINAGKLGGQTSYEASYDGFMSANAGAVTTGSGYLSI